MSGGSENKSFLTCPTCGKSFRRRSAKHKFCTEKCRLISKKQRLRMKQGESKPVSTGLKYNWVKICITKPLNVHPEMEPEIGGVYTAKRIVGQCDRPSYIIPEIGKYGLLVRMEECREVSA